MSEYARRLILVSIVLGFIGMILVAVGSGGAQALGVFIMLWANNIARDAVSGP